MPFGDADTEARDDWVIEAAGLDKRFGEVHAVRGIDFRVRRGECFGFLGPNGAGKTTTMRMIYRATPVGGGSLRILGMEVAGGDADRAVKRRIGVVPQENNLDQDLSVRQNLEVFCRFYGLGRREARARTDELLDFVNLTARADARVLELSGGMKRRTLIARGLVGGPEIVVLDEPTTGLDPQARHALWDRMHALRRQRATLLLTTHYMDEAEQLCDRLVVMDEGRIVAEGAPRDLIAETVPPEVVEVHLEGTGGEAAAIGPLEERADKTRRLRDRLLLYTRDGEAMVRAAAHALPGHRTLLRRATLEDVFLDITGHELKDG